MSREMFTSLSSPLDWDGQIEGLINLLLKCVQTLPDSEKRDVLNKSIAPLFDAVEALNKVEKVPAADLILLLLHITGYQDFAQRLRPPKAVTGRETNGHPASFPATNPKPKEPPNVA